jgi:hypothetical protein
METIGFVAAISLSAILLASRGELSIVAAAGSTPRRGERLQRDVSTT